MVNRILLPVDFSERTRGAARYAEALAERFDSEVFLLHVLPPPHYEFGPLDAGGVELSDLFSNRKALIRQELGSFLCAELRHQRTRRILEDGDPATKIVGFAHDNQMDLVMMPTHGYGPFRRFILGSVTAKVLHDADCPVWTGVHMEEAPPAESIQLRNIVAALDLGPQSLRTLEWAAHLANEFNAKLTLVHALACMEPAGEFIHGDWRADMMANAREQMAALQGPAKVDAEVKIQCGDPPHVICGFAERLRADLLVIGRGSAAGVFGRLRANAYSIIRQSPCPVVSV
jgi:nucleotide-binding universal stress UspA family protein